MGKRIGVALALIILAFALTGAGGFYWLMIWPRIMGARPAMQATVGTRSDQDYKEPKECAHGEHEESGDHDDEGHDEHADHDDEKHDEHAEDDHDAHAGHDHGAHAHGADLDMSAEEILAARCEHEMPTLECAECRYEVGVVKLDASLMKGAPGVTNGIVKTIKVARRQVSSFITVTGEVQLNENTAAHISPRIAGIIRSVKFDIGAEVKKDDALFEIESVELGQAMSECVKARAMAKLSKKNYEREKSLFERKVSSERDMIEAQMGYEQYQAEVAAAEQKLCVLGLSDKSIEGLEPGARALPPGRLPVVAPSDGTIIEKHAVVGELAQPGQDVLLVADLSDVWVWANIYEQNLAPLLHRRRQGPIAVEVLVDAFPGRAFKGTMDYIGATMDEKTRTVKVRVVVKNDERFLRPGMFCQVRIPLAARKSVLAIPKVALLSDEGRDFVFKHLKGDYYVRRAVKTGIGFLDSVEIADGLELGETIVADGAFLLKSDVLREKMGEGCAH